MLVSDDEISKFVLFLTSPLPEMSKMVDVRVGVVEMVADILK